MLMITTVCIAAAQCMPCCIRDTKDCCERNAYRNTILRTNKTYTIVAMSISTESDNSNPSTTDDDDDDDDDTDETDDEDVNNSGDDYVYAARAYTDDTSVITGDDHPAVSDSL